MALALGIPGLKIGATAVRVLTLISHAESVFVETESDLSPSEAKALWGRSSGIQVMDDSAADIYPVNVNTANEDVVAVGRVGRDPSVEHGLCFWGVSDNLRKGAALNAGQIAEVIRNLSL